MKEPSAPTKWGFIDDLKSPIHKRIVWHRVRQRAHEVDLSKGVALDFRFPDPAGMLDVAYADFRCFLQAGEIETNGKYKIITDKIATDCFESYKIAVANNSCTILANDTEGIRRALVFLEDEILKNDGPFLDIGVRKRKPFVKTRISRCFFGPIKRPPLNRDELADEVDYYPEEYLNRLVHEGVNGLWMTVSFKDLCQTSFTPKYGEMAGQRLAKLRRTVEKCLRYGIKIYLFCIEPAAWPPESEVLKQYPELGGADLGATGKLFCPFSDTAQRYLYQSVNGIFKAVPGLGGIINISHGERATTCLSSIAATESRTVNCQVCSRKRPWEILHASLSAMANGMHDAAPDAQLISWLYAPQDMELAEWVFEIPENMPSNVIFQFNFESGGKKEQLGRIHYGGDYWLSYVGPSKRFDKVARAANRAGVPIAAKIQVGCSHEVATVPFVPVPGLLYRKYREMHRLGVSCVMQCWYFGNYPGIMNKAAGELSFEYFDTDEQAFLKRLAAIYWGRHADKTVAAWTLFAEAYGNYTFSNMFQYYGPIHDGAVWPLYLYPAYKPLAPTWRLEYPASGDFIGECLKNHTLEEAIVLCRELSVKWHRGATILSSLKGWFKNNPDRLKDIGLSMALGIQFACGYNILRFYKLREHLFSDTADKTRKLFLLDEMEAIARSEIRNSKHLLKLCEKDARLGFHSEAEGYKYFPRKLRWRIDALNGMLSKILPDTRQKVANGQLDTFPPGIKSYRCNSGATMECDSFRWQATCTNNCLRFHVECDGKETTDQLLLTLAQGTTRFPVIINACRTPSVLGCLRSDNGVEITENENGWQAEIRLPIPDNEKKLSKAMGLSLVRIGMRNHQLEVHSLHGSVAERYRLGLGFGIHVRICRSFTLGEINHDPGNNQNNSLRLADDKNLPVAPEENQT